MNFKPFREDNNVSGANFLEQRKDVRPARTTVASNSTPKLVVSRNKVPLNTGLVATAYIVDIQNRKEVFERGILS